MNELLHVTTSIVDGRERAEVRCGSRVTTYEFDRTDGCECECRVFALVSHRLPWSLTNPLGNRWSQREPAASCSHGLVIGKALAKLTNTNATGDNDGD